MTIVYHADLEQGSDEWFAARCGILTASEMDLILSPTLKPASNKAEKTHLYELLAQRIGKYVEPSYSSRDQERGHADEVEARAIYESKVSPVTSMGFVTNDRWGFKLGCSPDGLVGTDGAIECKSRRQAFQFRTIIECAAEGTIPDEYMLQVQTILLVTERKWVDFVSYCGGHPMIVTRVFPRADYQAEIVKAATAFEMRIVRAAETYEAEMKGGRCGSIYIPTERKIEEEMFV